MTLVEMARTMLDEHRTPSKFWATAISTMRYISNWIFLCSILNLTSYELHFGRKPKVSHLRVSGCRCFILKRDNLDKFESRSSDGIFLGYSLYGHSYRVYNLDTNNIMESCDVTFDESTTCASSAFRCAGDKEIREIIFVDGDLPALDDDKNDPLIPVITPSSELTLASSIPVEGPVASTSTSTTFEPAPISIEGEFISQRDSIIH